MANSLSKLNIIVKYDAGYIYGIYHQDNLKYIGSTIDFKSRMWTHKTSCYNVKSKKRNLQIYQYIRSNGKWEDFEFKIIDVYYSITKKLLNRIEGEYIRYFGLENLLNQAIAGRTDSEYRDDNQVELKKYYQVNKKKICNRVNDYRLKNKAKIKARISKPWTCSICNKTVNTGSKSRHLKTTKHLKKANEININLINI